jgi:hypothetical protein
MRAIIVVLLAGVLLAQAPPSQPPEPKAVGTMSELMIDVV